MPSPRCGGWSLAKNGFHHALRRGLAKTFMRSRNIRTTHGFEPKDLGLLADRGALDQLFSVTYEELRRLASSVRRGDPSATLNPTALVNEAWLKLANSPGFSTTSPLHFKRIAARAMRQVLIEAARRRNARKRGGGEGVAVTFDESMSEASSWGKDLLALNTALDELSRIQPRQAMMVEGRFFGGLDISETAALLEVSEATILRDWRAAKAWLAHELRRAR
ncbi:MAG: ECF-type sigma factor [Acidobacteriota bacterium]